MAEEYLSTSSCLNHVPMSDDALVSKGCSFIWLGTLSIRLSFNLEIRDTTSSSLRTAQAFLNYFLRNGAIPKEGLSLRAPLWV